MEKGKFHKYIHRCITGILLVALLPWFAGCEAARDYTITGQMWDNDNFIYHYQPATNANLQLFQKHDHKDILVQYDEEREKTGDIKRRAYFLSKNGSDLAAWKKPHFVSPSHSAGMTPVPIVPAGVNWSNQPPEFWAEIGADGQSFTLFKHDSAVLACRLPTYPERFGEVARAMLTPLTVAADVVILAAIAAVIGGLIYVSGSVQNGSWDPTHK